MKQKKNHGFTIVELVVVIAIIAVLAAVLIPTFASIIKKANDSAYLQERTNQQIADLAEKVEKKNYLTWEDFEAKLAEELAKVGSGTVDKTALENAVKEAMKEYAVSDSGLSETQVKTIVEKALEGQLTTAQVQAIVEQAIKNSGLTIGAGGITPEQVKSIVNSAIAKIPTQTGVTTTQMQNAIKQAISSANLSSLTPEQVDAAIANALKGFATNKDLESAVQEILNNMSTTAIVENAVIDAFKGTNDPSFSGSKNITIAGDLVFSGNTGTGDPDGSLTVNNPNATVNLNASGHTVTVLEEENVAYNGGRLLQVTAGTLNISGGNYVTDERSWGFVRCYENGVLNINGATGSNCRGNGMSVKVMGGIATLNNVTINSAKGGCVCVDQAYSGDTRGNLVINSGVYNQVGYYDFCSCAVAASGGGTMTINGGTFTSDGGESVFEIWSSPANVTINGGTFTASGSHGGTDTLAIKIYNVEQKYYTSYGMGTTVTINGGTFTGGISVGTDYCSLVIKGGSFTVDPSAYVDTTAYNVTLSDGVYTVTAK